MQNINIIRVESMDIPELIAYAGMSEPQLKTMFEPQVGAFVAETQMIIKRALEAGYEPISYLIEDTYLSCFMDEIPKNFYATQPVYVASHDVLCKITGYELTRGMLALMRRKTEDTPKSVLCDARRIVVLEDVMNPTNLGAIVRTAAALNADAFALTKGSTDPLYRRAVRVSMGNIFQLPWCYCELDEIKRMGFRTVAMALRKNSVEIDDPGVRACEKLAVVMGTEGPGLRDETIDSCDYVVKIPMRSTVDSLNVSAAAAIAMWELFK